MFVSQLLLNLVIQEVVKTIILCQDGCSYIWFNDNGSKYLGTFQHSHKNIPEAANIQLRFIIKKEACVHRSTSCYQSTVVTGVTQPTDLKEEAVDTLSKIRSMHLTRLCLFLQQYSNLIKTSRKLKSVHLHMYISSQLILYLAQGNTYIFFMINISYR